MIRYKARRYFEYITLKTPILSLLIAAIVLWAAFSIAAGVRVEQYERFDAVAVGIEDNKEVFSAKIPKEQSYYEEHAYIFFDDETIGIKCHLIRKDIMNDSIILYFSPDNALIGYTNSTEVYIDLVTYQTTLLRKLLGGHIDD